ncbi:magnesium transporter CorA family protein [Ideonella sp. BN130291]|uniref:magnesium transporter CorA family protein n=1 Tax=Ideonella sp. BN130291 TaxID=3112940 RepID=UPI002E26B2A7|nr:magnesium transporter CorA family protein [Ideonella sp. BN130291]
MRVASISADSVAELPAPPDALPPSGFVWLACSRAEFEAQAAELQALLQRWTGGQLVDLHVSDLLNRQLPSHFDYTSWYDVLVFRRLVAAGPEGSPMTTIDTSPVGFAVFDRVLLTIHPDDCTVRDHFFARLQQMTQGADVRNGSRLPASPADLMLRMVNHIVDSYLDLRRRLTRQLGEMQSSLLDPKNRVHDWQVLLDARNVLHVLEDTCEDQRSAVQEWIDAADEWPPVGDAQAMRERELLRVRARDVLEHIERVLTHVRRLESSAETAVQMHFSAVGQRTNDIMRTLTVLTAIFLPLNLITGVFGMNFDALPLIHRETGFWIAFSAMVGVGLALGAFFWRKRYLGTHPR